MVRADVKDHISLMSFDSNPNIGLYAFATDEFCLLAEEVADKHEDEIKNILQVPVYRMTIAGTGLLGVFLAGNANVVLVPEIANEDELKRLAEYGIECEVVSTKLTALGNNITSNKKTALVNDEFSDAAVKQIKNSLKIPVKKGKVAELTNVGSCLVVNNKGGLVHRDIKGFELEFLEKLFGCEIYEGTINMGNPYVKSGIIANSYGMIVGSHSGGPEINNADEALGFFEK